MLIFREMFPLGPGPGHSRGKQGNAIQGKHAPVASQDRGHLRCSGTAESLKGLA